MKPQFFAHPFSSYCQKVLIALYENGVDFDFRLIGPPDGTMREFETLWPLKRFPILVDDGKTILETSTIIEYLQLAYPGPVRLIPEDPHAAIEVRMMDRVFDNYIMTPASNPVFNAIRPEADRDPYGVTRAMEMLDTSYAWLDRRLAGREWAAGEFSLADCAAAPSLFYADWVHEIPAVYANLRAYRARLLARPSFARAVEGGRPFRHYFPLGAPDRD